MKIHFTNHQKEQGKDDWRWVLTGDNGEPMAQATEGYVHRTDALYCLLFATRFDVQPGDTKAVRYVVATGAGYLPQQQTADVTWDAVEFSQDHPQNPIDPPAGVGG